MQLYDTLAGAKKAFVVPTDRPVALYVCGVTPYDTTHMGHARTFMVFDTLVRYLKWQGAEVRYCQNVTDVDDPLFERAKRDGIDWRELAARETKRYTDDCAALGMLPPTYFPRASQEIDGMQAIIGRLIEQGHAYERNGNVYFSVASDPSYGAMARMGYDELLATANERGNNPGDPNKNDPLDFVLWQTGNPGDPTWPSPWGPGRPGWHIECSAMSTRYLGPQIDIHGGGTDLIFPHHPCEIAQTEPVTGVRPFVNFWMHTGAVALDGQKMSKSLGNMVFVRDAVKEHSPQALRWYLLGFPYREAFTYERAGVERAEQVVANVRSALVEMPRRSVSTGAALDASGVRAAFIAALDDDLNTPLGLALISGLASDIVDADGRDVAEAQATLRDLAASLGVML
ncbi:MAG: cysteine--tRNA ligase [Chloroflexales bacterium]|nr:cysteine--tRNA ligase [Chloroflexales bacterium]